ncbi:MAG TPA: DsbA family protein [Thermoleophilaceae bacterium]|nr:DsbA family protein [Thermoleophilaceae bacterium]
MAVRVRVYTDPACCWSWGAEPSLRRLMVEFGEQLQFTFLMGGLAREAEPEVNEWLEVMAETGMPMDPLIWTESMITSTYPACMAVKAAQEQATDGGYRYLRTVREGLVCFRRKLDTTEALVEEARRAGLDVQRFRVDLGSHAIVEAFGADLEATRSIPNPKRPDRVPFPTVQFGDGEPLFGPTPYEGYREAALAAGAEPAGGDPPTVEEALGRFGAMATPEVMAVCGLPEPRAEAELWRLAGDWRVKPVRILSGRLWEPA